MNLENSNFLLSILLSWEGSPRGRPYYELFWESKSETDLPFDWNTIIWRNLNWPSRFSLCRNPRLHYSVDPLKYPIQNNPHPVLPLILIQRKSQISHGRFTLPHPRGQFESLSEKVGVSTHWLGFARQMICIFWSGSEQTENPAQNSTEVNKPVSLLVLLGEEPYLDMMPKGGLVRPLPMWTDFFYQTCHRPGQRFASPINTKCSRVCCLETGKATLGQTARESRSRGNCLMPLPPTPRLPSWEDGGCTYVHSSSN